MAEINIDPSKTRIAKVRNYLFPIIDSLLTDKNYQVNANFLSNEINNYSLDRIPIQGDPVENWIISVKIYREVYELISRKSYGQDVMDNLSNVGFFEALEDMIYSNNKKGILPEIKGIESIKCLNCGALSIADTQKSVFAIQIEISYRK